MFCEVKTLSIEELVGRLRAAEARFEPTVEQVTDKVGRLLLTEDEWMARNKSRMVNADSTSGGSKGSTRYVKKDPSRGRSVSGSGKHGHDTRESRGGLTSKGTPRQKGRCRKCGVYGHWGKECMNKKAGKEEHEDAMHHVTADTEAKPALLVAQVCNIGRTSHPSAGGLFLNQERVFPEKYEGGAWILDTGATNHMTGCRSSLTSLDESVRGAVRFGDCSTVEICGVG